MKKPKVEWHPPPTTRREDALDTAYHESGHFVIAHMLGLGAIRRTP